MHPPNAKALFGEESGPVDARMASGQRAEIGEHLITDSRVSRSRARGVTRNEEVAKG
jgi:hypothetical protein